MGKRIGKTPMYPDYLPCSFPNKRLAIMKGNSIYVETGKHLTVDNLSHLIELLFSENILVFVASLTTTTEFPYLAESVQDKRASVLCNDEGWPLAIRYSGKKGRSAWVVPSSTWDSPCTLSFLQTLRKVFNIARAVKPTPGSLGGALLRRTWATGHYPRHSAPNAIALDLLRGNSVGGRCDTLVKQYKETQEIYPSLLELDGATFYLAHLLVLPTGTSRLFLSDHCTQYVTYFAKCYVTIHTELALGPFPVKRKKGKIVYPTLPGTYETHLWKEQIEDAKTLGCSVTIDGGFGWSVLTEDTTDICTLLYRYRMLYPDSPTEGIFKKVIVSMLGHLGMRNTFYTIVALEDAYEHEPCVLNENFHPQNYVVRENTDYTKPSMYHWFQYDIMQTSRSLFWMAYPYAEEGRLIATNYDAIIVREGNETSTYAEKHSLEAHMAQMGDWRWQRLTNVKIHGDRSVECDQKVTLPGVPIVTR